MREEGRIYIGGKPPAHSKLIRTPYIIVLIVIAVAAAGFFAYRYARLARPLKTVVVEEVSSLRSITLPGRQN